MRSGPTAVALKNARLYQDREQQMDALQRKQQQLVQSASRPRSASGGGRGARAQQSLTVILGHARSCAARPTARRPEPEPEARSDRDPGPARGQDHGGLLDFSRRREPKHEPVSFNALVPRALELIQSKLRGRSITVETHLADDAVEILGDADQLTQVLINLAGNAIDAMGDQGTLTVRTTLMDDGLEVAITDTAWDGRRRGVTGSFEPFYHDEARRQGTGLGLSSRSALEEPRRQIAVDSARGSRHTMRVRLPRSFVPETAPRVIA